MQGNICEIIGKDFEWTNIIKTTLETEFDSQFEKYRAKNQEEGTENISDKLSKFSILEKVRESNINDVMMDFDATFLYPSAMYDENSVYSKRKSGFSFKLHINDV